MDICRHTSSEMRSNGLLLPVLGQFNPALPSHSLDNPPSVPPRLIKMKMMTPTFSVQFHPTCNDEIVLTEGSKSTLTQNTLTQERKYRTTLPKSPKGCSI